MSKKPTIKDGAACAFYEDEEVFIWYSEERIHSKKAKQICMQDCPVQTQCLEWALENPGLATYLTYGGYTQSELKRLRNIKRNEI